jgi:predicted metal-dependent hydrolase
MTAPKDTMLGRFKFFVDESEKLIRKPVNVHISNGLIGYKGVCSNEATSADIILSMEEVNEYNELEDVLIHEIAHIVENDDAHTHAFYERCDRIKADFNAKYEAYLAGKAVQENATQTIR